MTTTDLTTSEPRSLDFYVAAFAHAAVLLDRETAGSVRAAINTACGAPVDKDEATALRIFAELNDIPPVPDADLGAAVDAWQAQPDAVRGGHSPYHCLFFTDHWLESTRFLIAQGQPQPTPVITAMAAVETASRDTEVPAA